LDGSLQHRSFRPFYIELHRVDSNRAEFAYDFVEATDADDLDSLVAAALRNPLISTLHSSSRCSRLTGSNDRTDPPGPTQAAAATVNSPW
jgi:hypothetical protein